LEIGSTPLLAAASASTANNKKRMEKQKATLAIPGLRRTLGVLILFATVPPFFGQAVPTFPQRIDLVPPCPFFQCMMCCDLAVIWSVGGKR
jgi:hypothetical protein